METQHSEFWESNGAGRHIGYLQGVKLTLRALYLKFLPKKCCRLAVRQVVVTIHMFSKYLVPNRLAFSIQQALHDREQGILEIEGESHALSRINRTTTLP